MDVAHCHAVIEEQGGILLTLFLAGLGGSFTHCAGMCGPFVLGQVGARMEATPAAKLTEWRRLTGAALLPYHFGRMTTYVVLGALAAWLVSGFAEAASFQWISASLLVLAGGLFIAASLQHYPKILGQANPLAAINMPIPETFKTFLHYLFASPVGGRGYVLGVLLGFLPCGLLYAALAAVASTKDPLAGAMAMAVFAIGTMPALFLVAFGGNFVMNRWRKGFSHLARAVMAVNGIILFVTAGQLIA